MEFVVQFLIRGTTVIGCRAEDIQTVVATGVGSAFRDVKLRENPLFLSVPDQFLAVVARTDIYIHIHGPEATVDV